jgi:uncharacterized protein YjbI with pentapeptide repeats
MNVTFKDGTTKSIDTTNLANIDLRNAQLSCADFSGRNLEGANLLNADLGWAKMDNCKLADAKLGGADLHNASLRGADMVAANIAGANFSGADMAKADLIRVKANSANFRGTNLEGAILESGTFYKANFNSANLTNADLNGADINHADFTKAIMNNADMRGTIGDAYIEDALGKFKERHESEREIEKLTKANEPSMPAYDWAEPVELTEAQLRQIEVNKAQAQQQLEETISKANANAYKTAPREEEGESESDKIFNTFRGAVAKRGTPEERLELMSYAEQNIPLHRVLFYLANEKSGVPGSYNIVNIISDIKNQDEAIKYNEEQAKKLTRNDAKMLNAIKEEQSPNEYFSALRKGLELNPKCEELKKLYEFFVYDCFNKAYPPILIPDEQDPKKGVMVDMRDTKIPKERKKFFDALVAEFEEASNLENTKLMACVYRSKYPECKEIGGLIKQINEKIAQRSST